MLDQGLLLIFPAAMIFAASMDVFTMTIPNRISLFLIGAFLVVAPISGMSLEQIGMHLAVGLAMLLVCVALFAMRILGGGDAKLIAAASLWMGLSQLGPYMFKVALVGGVLAILFLAYRRIVPEMMVARWSWAHRLHQKDVGIPYGVAIAGGALWAFPGTALFQGLAA